MRPIPSNLPEITRELARRFESQGAEKDDAYESAGRVIGALLTETTPTIVTLANGRQYVVERNLTVAKN
jgi:hypothetical protein